MSDEQKSFGMAYTRNIVVSILIAAEAPINDHLTDILPRGRVTKPARYSVLPPSAGSMA